MLRVIVPLAILAVLPAFALTPADCTFYAPYDGSLDAAQSLGPGQATVEGSLQFVEGLRGQGVLVGAPNTGLKYATERNFLLDAGSISIWVKPVDWNDTDAAMRFFVAVSQGPAQTQADGGTFLWLYRFFAHSTYFLAWDSRGFPRLAAQNRKVCANAFQAGQWTHLVGTWNGDEMRLYINGVHQSTARMTTSRLLRSVGEFFTVGDPNRANKADTVLDELRLFNRALTAPEVAALHEMKLEAPADRQEITAALLPGAQKVRADINAIGNTPAEAKALTAQVALQPAGGGAALQPAQVRFTDQAHTVAEFSTAKLPLGNYKVVSMLMDGGKAVATTEATFTIKAPPAWLGSNLGLSDKVPAPWTPLKMSGDRTVTIECWGPRRYAVATVQSLLPTQMETCGASILAAPMSLLCESDGASPQWRERGFATREESAARIVFATMARADGIRLQTECSVEYDGLLWTKLRIIPQGSVKLSRLALEIPLAKPAATLMQTGYGYEEAGAVKAVQHRISTDAQVWLGNEDGGLQVTVPSSRNFLNADRNKQLQIEPQADRVVLRLNFMDKETTIKAPLEYEFALQLTPTRPRPAGWRLWRITPPAEVRGVHFNPFYTEGWDVGTSYPIPRPEWEKIFNAETAKGNLATPYLQPYSVWPGMPDYPQFASEWRTQLTSAPPPFDPQADRMAMMGVCPRNASWPDYFLGTFFGLYEGQYKNMGWGALYFDVTHPPMCDNADHGCGHRDEYGVWQGETRHLDARAVQQRFYVAMQERWPSKLLFNHESGQPNMMQLSFVHGMIDGEHLTLALPPQDFKYHDILPLDRMRAQYMGSNYGFVPIFLPEFSRGGNGNVALMKRLFLTPEPAEFMHLVGLLMIHDILPWPAYAHPGPVHHWWAVQDAFGFEDEKLEFLPYWKNADLVKLSPSDANVVCSMYRKPGKLLLIVMNNTDAEREVTLKLDAAKLGLPAVQNGSLLDAWQAASFETDSYEINDKGDARRKPERLKIAGQQVLVPFAAGQCKLTVPPRAFRVLVTP